eukprot:CAMPEP_0171208774 /NCGR_PEP_ID=MMETSP0790-20130122/28259_1 /TAXON_ID=2925 /ORGANISM="Alexandrium catenella, Strain OF101" /LENGTH=358 /DNA_ID=CAMNT_0011674375 /DNA_START=118 /DNA_END=1192 /DNA_ORIENTATION=-
MKLKRFLLRYEPPGIGLEVEDDGTIDVRHKDLWLTPSVKSQKDINLLVDRLIADEPEILTKRRHRPALVQLLCRLYQLDDESREDIEAHSPREEFAPAKLGPPAAQSDGLHLGRQVVLIGLRGNLQVHNGQLGTLTAMSAKKSEYEVLLHAGRTAKQSESLRMKTADHLLPVALSGVLSVGTSAVIHGLVSHHDLNGCICDVVRCQAEAQRCEVRVLENGLHYRMKSENLLPVQQCPHSASVASRYGVGKQPSPSKAGGGGLFRQGSTVQIVGLKSCTYFNGQLAEVLHADEARGRYAIRMSDGSTKTIKFPNVQLVSAPSALPSVAEGPTAALACITDAGTARCRAAVGRLPLSVLL